MSSNVNEIYGKGDKIKDMWNVGNMMLTTQAVNWNWMEIINQLAGIVIKNASFIDK